MKIKVVGLRGKGWGSRETGFRSRIEALEFCDSEFKVASGLNGTSNMLELAI